MSFKQLPRIPVRASAKRSGARITTSRTPPIMGFKQIPQTPVGADLSAFVGCSALPLHLLKLIIGLYRLFRDPS